MPHELSKADYLFLLEKEQKGESLSPSEKERLEDYKKKFDLYLAYNRRFEYLTLFENYFQGKIDLDNFYEPFYDFFYEDIVSPSSRNSDLEQVAKNPMDFEIFSKVEKFSDLIMEIGSWYDHPYEVEFLKSFYDSNYQPDFESVIELIHKNYREIKELLK